MPSLIVVHGVGDPSEADLKRAARAIGARTAKAHAAFLRAFGLPPCGADQLALELGRASEDGWMR
jgi:hypothetical protein